MSAKAPLDTSNGRVPEKRNLAHAAQNEASISDTERARDLIASRVTTQPVETVVAVLSAHRGGQSINAAAKVAGVNYRTAQRILGAGAVRDEVTLAGIS